MHYTLIWWMLIYCKFQKTQTNSMPNQQLLVCSFLPCFCALLCIWGQVAGILKSILPRSPSWSPTKLYNQWELFVGGGGGASGTKISVLYLLLPSVSLASVTRRKHHRTSRFWHQHPEILAVPLLWLIYFLSLSFAIIGNIIQIKSYSMDLLKTLFSLSLCIWNSSMLLHLSAVCSILCLGSISL